MNKLTIEQLAPYLPYGLQAVLTQDHREDFSGEDYYDENIFIEGAIWEVSGYADGKLHIPCGEGDLDGFIYNSGYAYACFDNGIKPILRPMSDLTKEITHNGEMFVPIDYLNGEFAGKIPRKFEVNQTIRNPNIFFTLAEWISFKELHELFELLFSWHFDVFGLINKGLAINKNEVKEETK